MYPRTTRTLEKIRLACNYSFFLPVYVHAQFSFIDYDKKHVRRSNSRMCPSVDGTVHTLSSDKHRYTAEEAKAPPAILQG